jgi:hypothetical protein
MFARERCQKLKKKVFSQIITDVAGIVVKRFLGADLASNCRVSHRNTSSSDPNQLAARLNLSRAERPSWNGIVLL